MVEPAVGQVWRGVIHGSLLKVLAVNERSITCLWMYTGNPYYLNEVGTVRNFFRMNWHDLWEYAPEWNDRTQMVYEIQQET